MSTGLRSQLAPKGLHFNPSDFFISDKYATILTVVSYPKYITPGYLSSLTKYYFHQLFLAYLDYIIFLLQFSHQN